MFRELQDYMIGILIGIFTYIGLSAVLTAFDIETDFLSIMLFGVPTVVIIAVVLIEIVKRCS